MGQRGPAPTPSVIRDIRDNPGHRRKNWEEPAPDRLQADDKLAACPAHLKGDARTFWKRHAPICLRLGTLTASDTQTFAVGCVAYGELRDLERLSKKLGIEMAIAKGVRKDLHATRADFMRFSQRFGLDPSSRSNVRIAPGRKTSETGAFRGRKARGA